MCQSKVSDKFAGLVLSVLFSFAPSCLLGGLPPPVYSRLAPTRLGPPHPSVCVAVAGSTIRPPPVPQQISLCSFRTKKISCASLAPIAPRPNNSGLPPSTTPVVQFLTYFLRPSVKRFYCLRAQVRRRCSDWLAPVTCYPPRKVVSPQLLLPCLADNCTLDAHCHTLRSGCCRPHGVRFFRRWDVLYAMEHSAKRQVKSACCLLFYTASKMVRYPGQR
jgi:hypothetical protein